MRLFKALALLHIFVAALMIGFVATRGSIQLSQPESAVDVASLALLTFWIFIAGSLLYSGAQYLRRPTRKSALGVAAGVFALIWIFSTVTLVTLGLESALYNAAALAAGFLVYRFALKPLAHATFPAE